MLGGRWETVNLGCKETHGENRGESGWYKRAEEVKSPAGAGVEMCVSWWWRSSACGPSVFALCFG